MKFHYYRDWWIVSQSVGVLTFKDMSKDKGGKNVKKAPTAEGKKNASDYQNGKKSVSKDDAAVNKKK